MADDFERIDWQAERDAMRAPAYFGRASSYDMQRGENAEERATRLAASRANKAGRDAHGDNHCPGCGRSQRGTTECNPCRDARLATLERVRQGKRGSHDRP